jgi:uncharacterized membrane protein YccC
MRKLVNQLYAFDFLKGLILTFCLSVPLYLGIHFDKMGYGLAFALGVFYTFLPNTNGNNRHRIQGILFALGLALFITLLSYLSREISDGFYILFFVVCIFSVSMLSIYGFRASMVAFSGHFALIMSFALLKTDLSIQLQLLMIFGGGLWYLLFAIVLHSVFQNKTANHTLAECVEYTAEFLKERHKQLWNEKGNSFESDQKISKIQIELIENHELLRELLFHKRRNEGQSNKTNRLLLLFLEMLDIYEITLGIHTDAELYIENLGAKEFERLQAFKEVSAKVVVHLFALAEALKSGKELPIMDGEEEGFFEQCEIEIQNYVSKIGLPKARSGALLLRNLQDNQSKQWQKVFAAKRIYANLLKGSEKLLKRSERSLFLTSQDYSFKTLKNNLSFESSTFRHALRLSLAMLVGLVIGRFFEHQNAYWILLTIAVILRPNFGLTKARALHRIFGTFIGATIAVCILLLFEQKWIYGLLAIPCLFVGVVFLQKSYRVATSFITAAVILLYGVLVDNAFTLVRYRVIDTLIGGVVSFLAIYLLWPIWEEKSIKTAVKKASMAVSSYFREINRIYVDKVLADMVYRLARKKALIDNSNLMAAFQRHLEEPKSHQEHAAQIYAAVVLNQTFISALAAFSTFVQNHETTAASEEYKTMVQGILRNLDAVQVLIDGEKPPLLATDIEMDIATQGLEDKYRELEESRNNELSEGFKPLSTDLRSKLQEAKLVTDHLKWLLGLSENMRETAAYLD